MWRDFLDYTETVVNMVSLGYISLFCLGLVFFTMMVSIFSFGQRTSLPRATGHVLLGIWAVSRFEAKLDFLHTTPEHLILHLALALICFDTLHRLFKQKRRSGGNFLHTSVGE